MERRKQNINGWGRHTKQETITFEKTETKLENILKYIDDIHNKSYEEKRAFIWGFFYGDGSCGKYSCEIVEDKLESKKILNQNKKGTNLISNSIIA